MPKKRGGKRGRKVRRAPAAAEPEPEPEPWICAECEQENESSSADPYAAAMCLACDEPRPGGIGGAVAASAAAARRRRVDLDDEAFLYQQVLSPGECGTLIEMSRQRTLSLEEDSVDDRPMYQVDLVRHGMVADRALWAAIGPLFETRLRPLLAELPWLRGAAFNLDFAFLKRYRPDERTHLGIHTDSSFFTFNLLLSDPGDDFEGGEIYLFTPQQTRKHFARHEGMTTDQKAAWVAGHGDGLPKVMGYGRGDVLTFTGDRHLHGTLPVRGGERIVVTFFSERLAEDAMGLECADCQAWRERCEYSKAQLRKGNDLASCRACTRDAGRTVCPACGGTAESHNGAGCCSGTDAEESARSHKGADRPRARPFATISFPS